ncbi:MAG: type II toxin-antitoxin system VapC family toxin [Ferruginibacter sp.]
MNYLLDTHALIWFLNGDKELSSKARKAIESPEAINFVSIVSLWEIAIKVSLDKLDLKTPFEKIGEEISNNNFEMVPITFQDTLILSSLPFHHRDPFDRLLIAQGINNKFTIISKDQHFNSYKIKVLW